MKTYIFTIITFLLSTQAINSQEVRSDNFIAFGANYGIDVPFGDMADRYGRNFHAGISIDLFRKKLNGIISLEGSIFFGDNVKEDVLSPLRLTNGSILGSDGAYVDVFLRQRGTYLGITVDKIIIPSKSNKHSGLSIAGGLGIMQHNIRLNIDSNNAPQFDDNYQKGYDRNSLGLALKQKIGFINIGKTKSVNYEIALSITEGFTKSTRGLDFDTMLKNDNSRIDILIGLDFKWMIPLSIQGREEEEYFY